MTAWAGPLLRSYELPNSNVLLAGVSGQVGDVTGRDPLPYAQGALRSWVGGSASDPGQADFWTVGAPAPVPSPSDPTSLLGRVGLTVALGALALILVAVGAYAFVTGD